MVCGLPSTVIYGVQIALFCDLWCVECPLVLSLVCGLPSTVISGVWNALYSDLWYVDCPLL